jgi:phosphoribosylanthranilate isomerase
VLVKICGATVAGEVAGLAAAGADLVGLWHGVRHGHADLTLDALAQLSGVATAHGRPRPVLVTTESDVDILRPAVTRSRVRWVQLHGYQPPGTVRALRSACPGLTVVKALHVRAGVCVEQALLGAYERSGVDVFLLDSLTGDGRLGSTGQTIDPGVVTTIADRLSRPFLLAGGLTASNAARFRQVAAHPRFLGIDVDSAGRGQDGRIDPDRVVTIRENWDGRGADEPLR